MRFALLGRLFFPKTIVQTLNPFISMFTTSSLADKLYTQLKNNPASPEKALKLMKPNLDMPTVDKLVRRFSGENPLLGLRFFVWAGIQTPYKHTSFDYTKACQILHIGRNPQLLLELLDSYMSGKCLVGVKTFNVVLNLCKECKLSGEAISVLRKMSEFRVHPNTTVYNIVIKLLCDSGDMDSAKKLLDEMESVQLCPDVVTYVSLIKGFCNVGRLDEASELFRLMEDHGCVPNVVIYSALLDGVSRFGSMEKAFELLEEMENEGGKCAPNVVTYTSMIQSLCEKGRLDDALKILSRMQLHGCSPNRVTVSVLLENLCVAQRIEEAYKLVEKSVEMGGVSCSDCYSSLVVSLIRVKKIKEAEGIFRMCCSSGVKLDGLACSMIIKELCLEKRMVDGFLLLEEIEKNEWLCSIDNDIYSFLLIGLCESNHMNEALRVVELLIEKKIMVKSPYSNKVAEFLKHFNDGGLLQKLGCI